jgi:hypothetical protein
VEVSYSDNSFTPERKCILKPTGTIPDEYYENEPDTCWIFPTGCSSFDSD